MSYLGLVHPSPAYWKYWLSNSQLLLSPEYYSLLEGTTPNRGSWKLKPHIFGPQIRSVAQSCLTLCNPMNHSTPGLPVPHQLPGFTQTHVHRVGDAIQPPHPLLSPFSSCFQSFSASGSFPMSQFFTLGGQSIGASASASELPVIFRVDFF